MTPEEAYRQAVQLLNSLDLLLEGGSCEACETEEFKILERGFRATYADPSEWPYAKPTEDLL